MASAEVVICGAGIAGVAAAYELAVERRIGRVVIVDPEPPLSVTSDKSTECYRNFWPAPELVRFMNRSIDRLERWHEESGGRFALNRNGYAYFTAAPDRAAEFARAAEASSRAGAGPLRRHRGEPGDPQLPESEHDRMARGLDGFDLLLEPRAVRARYPWLRPDVCAALLARRCGWLSAQQLGMWLLERAREHGAELVAGELVAVERTRGGVSGVEIRRGGGSFGVTTPCVIDAAGPRAAEVAALVGLELPLVSELHGKVYFEDVDRVVPRELPLCIWCDPVALDWAAEERAELRADPELRFLTETMTGGVHFRPEGGPDGRMLLLLWTYHLEPTPVVFPPRFDPFYPEVVLRGMAQMVPEFARYLGDRRRPFVDGGYYTKTRENRPLIGPTPVPGFHLMCGMSGWGIMAAAAACELLGDHLAGEVDGERAGWFSLARYDDADYRARLEAGEFSSGQL
jgi:glycine/D-amino acid oxidase-like deaminating enzyme